ncbi:MAG TPA: hypothetical protein VLA27_07485, partial [Paracoccaceae bacterium]|nr:hypothetical protein [Paracoccaceae bacterium]
LLVLPLVLAGVLAALSLQAGFWGFVAAYLGLMLIIAMTGSAEATVMNQATPDRYRSSIQSLASLMMRGGAAVVTLPLIYVVKTYGIDTGWKIAAAILFAYAVLRLVLVGRRPPSPPAETENGQ